MSQADLEISLFHRSANDYGVTLRFRHPTAGQDKSASGFFALDEAALRQRQHDPADYGEQLAAQCFHDGNMRSFLDQALAVAASQQTPLHLRLFIHPGAEALHSLRWETLRLPGSAAPLAAGEWVRFSRYLDSAGWRPARTVERDALAALVAVASPDVRGTTLAEVRTEDQLVAARDGLGDIPFTALAGRGQVTLATLLARLRDGCDILYLVAHGMIVDGEPHILLEREDGGRAWTAGRELAARLGELAQPPSLVVLVSCQSAGADGQWLAQDNGALAGLGPRLAAAGVPAVVAMQGNLTMDTAAAFMPVFLRELRRDGVVDRAIAVARGAVRQRMDWWMPVLFTRLEDGRVFDLAAMLPPPPCPYPGMVPFRAEDTRFFYGREGEIQQMLDHLRHQRLLLVIGPSGSGKSSLIAAGLLPRLEKSTYFAPGFWLVRTMRPLDHPLAALAACLEGDISEPEQAVTTLLTVHAPAQRLLLVIDQFEEAFSLADKAERQQLMTALQILRRNPQCALVIALRADFYPDLMNCELWPVDPGQRLEVAVLRGDALRQAIRQPAAGVEVEIDEALIERLLADAAGEPGALPMLQETLVLLWERMRRRQITLSAYEQLGDGERSGLAVAVARKADATVAELTPAEQMVAQRIFLRLIQFGEGRRDTRRQLPAADLRSAADNSPAFERTLEHLARNRLLTLSGEEGDASRRVDISHEALISDWPRLQEWLRERKEAELMRRRLEDKAKEWVRLGRGEGGMLDKEELAEVDDWLAGQGANELGASAALLALVEASRKAINPGWSRQGAVAVIVGAVSFAALAAWVYVTIETSSLQGINRAATIIFLIGIAAFVGTVGWQLLRSGPYVLQRLSHSIISKRSSQVALLVIATATVFLWVVFGARNLLLTTECARMGINWTSDTIGIAIISEGADPKEVEVYRLTLQNAIAAQKSMVVSVDDSVAQKCKALFRHRITVSGTRDADEQEAVFVASMASASNEGVPLATIGKGCGEIVALAHKTAFALGYVDAPVANCQISGPVACEPWLLNEEAYALYRQNQFKEAEARFDALVKRYPDFAWAIHNLGMTKSANCQDPANAVSHLQTAVALTNENCGWFLYDLALVCRAAGDHICASEAAAQVIKIEPSFEDAYNALSVIYRESGRLDEAANMLNEYALRVGNTDQARWDQMTALEKNQGILAFEQGRYADALAYLRKAEQRMKQVNFVRRAASDQPLPYEEEIVFYLGRVNEELGNAAAACSYWQRHARLPQNCLFGETERRRYALDQLRAQMCER